jgi:hypothetical protein
MLSALRSVTLVKELAIDAMSSISKMQIEAPSGSSDEAPGEQRPCSRFGEGVERLSACYGTNNTLVALHSPLSAQRSRPVCSFKKSIWQYFADDAN